MRSGISGDAIGWTEYNSTGSASPLHMGSDRRQGARNYRDEGALVKMGAPPRECADGLEHGEPRGAHARQQRIQRGPCE